VNGSGKHFNWSIGDNTGENYLSPSKSPLKNINFLVTVGAILLGVKKYGGILRASVADAGNDHRLGANEAPPAIMSVYLGEYLDNLLNEIEGIGKLTQKKMDDINTGVRNLPKLAKDTSDRNRTSPIAFTGNKFEFRAVGSSHNCAEPGTVLNLIVAYGYDEICRRIKANKGADKKTVAIEVLKDVIKETKAVRFEGNNYSDEWHKEAEKRGLINRTNTPSAIELFLDKEVAKLYEKYNVLTEQELHSKVDIKLEAYIKTKEIEYKTAIDIAQTGVLASLALDISRKAKAAKRLKEVAGENAVLTKHIAELSKVYSQISKGIDVLKAALKTCESEKDILKQAHSYAEKGGKALEELRAAVDEAETMISKDLWTMASYQDLLLKL
ncbi:MAG: glutamine synthetase type III, partial [Candidatus Omnitrophica bacterium]|nr:glutamine synthetase type III [Candidatus Omnitrophota bacterium]